MAKAKRTQPRYFNIGRNASNPMVAMVREIIQNTPIGAAFITVMVISIITSLNSPKNLVIVKALFPSFASMIPTKTENTMIGNISPSAIEEMMFLGMIFKMVSAMLMLSFTVTSPDSTAEMDSPMPGRTSMPSAKAIVIARDVVAV